MGAVQAPTARRYECQLANIASMFALINAERLRANTSTVGFMYLALYKFGERFTGQDNVLKDNTVSTNPRCSTLGFTASAGCDPVTGLGTPRYAKLRDVFLALL